MQRLGRFNYLILIFIFLLEDLYILSPLNLIFALNVPFLLNFLILNTALPFLLILALQILPLTFNVSFLPAFRYFLPLTEDPFIVVRVTVILLIFLLALNFLFLALIFVFFLINIQRTYIKISKNYSYNFRFRNIPKNSQFGHMTSTVLYRYCEWGHKLARDGRKPI